MSDLFRLMDALINRSCEGIRVIEDLVRFSANNRELSAQLRACRHRLRVIFRPYESKLIRARSIVSDVGVKTSALSKSDVREKPGDIIPANFRRAQEATRSLEEAAKAASLYAEAKQCELIRFELYALHQQVDAIFVPAFPVGLYAITDEKFSNGRDAIFQAKELARAGVPILQYREKYKGKRYKLEQAREIRKITADAGVLFIVNDDVDIALAVEADGIHIGQDDMPADEVRKLVGPRMMIGLSTHNGEQLREASRLPVDYIGVGPIYSTETKVNVCDPVGLSYLDEAVAADLLPLVAIGGIKEHNIKAVLNTGAKTVCLVTEIIGAENIRQRAMDLASVIYSGNQSNNK